MFVARRVTVGSPRPANNSSVVHLPTQTPPPALRHPILSGPDVGAGLSPVPQRQPGEGQQLAKVAQVDQPVVDGAGWLALHGGLAAVTLGRRESGHQVVDLLAVRGEGRSGGDQQGTLAYLVQPEKERGFLHSFKALVTLGVNEKRI